MVSAACYDKLLILIPHRQAMTKNCLIRMSLSRLFLKILDMINATYYDKPLIFIGLYVHKNVDQKFDVINTLTKLRMLLNFLTSICLDKTSEDSRDNVLNRISLAVTSCPSTNADTLLALLAAST